MTKKIVIYTDGACSGNPGPGGWGALLEFENDMIEIFGHEISTTNNRMEITSAIEALKALPQNSSVVLYTDSKYVQLGISEWIHGWIKNNWKSASKKPVKNIDLWQKLYDQTQKHDVEWCWVKGHSNNYGNEFADKLANKGKDIAMKLALCHS